MVDWPYILLIDAAEFNIATEVMTELFGEGDLPYVDRINIADDVSLPDGILEHYDAVIWHSHNNEESLYFEFAVEALTEYLDNGGTLVLSSTAACVNFGDGNFFRDYLCAELGEADDVRRRYVLGYDTDDNFNDVSLFLGAGDGAGFPSVTPTLNAVGEGVPVLYYDDEGEDLGIAAIKHETDNYKTLLLAFPIESVGGVRSDDRDVFLGHIWNWINGGQAAPGDFDQQPVKFALNPAYPNPFNSSSVILFRLDQTGEISLKVYDLSGREAAQLANGVFPAGQHQVTFDAASNGLSNGLYWVKLTSLERSATCKLLYIR